MTPPPPEEGGRAVPPRNKAPAESAASLSEGDRANQYEWRPLDGFRSIRTKLSVLVAGSVTISVLIGSKLLGIPGVLLGPSVAAMISAVIRVWAEDIEVVTGPSGPRLTETWVDQNEPEDVVALEELIDKYDQPEDDAEGPVDLTDSKDEKA